MCRKTGADLGLCINCTHLRDESLEAGAGGVQVREGVGVLGVHVVVVRRVHVLPGEVEGVGLRQKRQEGALLRRVVEDLANRRSRK